MRCWAAQQRGRCGNCQRRLCVGAATRAGGPEIFLKKLLTEESEGLLLCTLLAGVAQLVEHHLAKVDVESSSLFARSIFKPGLRTGFFVGQIPRVIFPRDLPAPSLWLRVRAAGFRLDFARRETRLNAPWCKTLMLGGSLPLLKRAMLRLPPARSTRSSAPCFCNPCLLPLSSAPALVL